MIKDTAEQENSILIVGGGWAGLATAVKLCQQGHHVTLFESARQIGGRARRISIETDTGKNLAVDNGQHLLIGAYHTILELLDDVGVDVEKNLMRQPLKLNMQSLQGNGLSLSTPKLPAPLHLLFALLGASGLKIRDRLAALRFASTLHRGRLATAINHQDISVTALLVQQKQTERLIAAFWEPLCLAIMNTPLHEASAAIFIRVLSDAFLKHRQDADLLFPRTNLGNLFPDPAIRYIEKCGGHVHLGMRVSTLKIENQKISGLYVDEAFIAGSHVVLATSIPATLSLVKTQHELSSLHTNISRFKFEPVTTIYLQYPADVQLSQPMQGLIDGCTQWMFDRKHCNQPGLIAVVISSRGPHMDETKDALAKRITTELAQLFPHWPDSLSQFVIREKRATFSSSVGINALRPDNQTTVRGLWLAGDYTNNGYPATLEGAVRSGVQCAKLINQTI
ncbi:Squalene/phytoene desaturase HopC [hydrothermal vent metagenome]|uniref:Squalene/phytoene desaturase HopC n=1 Tax=hydrothermal vent metagenome TaxID=652676 RepID=A0A3B1BDX6_9ZZZZ